MHHFQQARGHFAGKKSDQRQGVLNTDRQGFYELDIDKIIIVLYQRVKKSYRVAK